jgi:Zn-dependent protease
MFFISLAVHEFSHALLASKLGDNTAKDLGRLTLNPFKHADIVGTLIMPIASFASGLVLIGWAKPVPINRANFKNHLRDDAIVSFAGPFSNFILSILFLAALAISLNFISDRYIINLLWYGVFFNLFLFAFNLLPFPPLDGAYSFRYFRINLLQQFKTLGIWLDHSTTFYLLPLWNYFRK